jgi:hypothetical protein
MANHVWTLVWQDEFDRPEIDRTRWRLDVGYTGETKGVLGIYTNRPENACIENSCLGIVAREDKYPFYRYTSARSKTQGQHSWMYGREVVRNRTPTGQGVWPAFWMVGDDVTTRGWPDCGEIDIMENIGHRPDTVRGTIHRPGYCRDDGIWADYTLTLDHAAVTGNRMATDAGNFRQGGGDIYNGSGATLNLIDSSVVNNTATWSGGGVYSFFNSNTLIVRIAISGNVSNDLGGGIQSLGNAEIINSTISGNQATGWYGGALFVTDGVVNLTNMTVAGNISPAWAPADVFVGTFTDVSATLTLANTIVSSAQDNCFFAPWGSGVVTLMADHNNVLTDATCFAGAYDQVVPDAGLAPLQTTEVLH